MIRTGDHVSYRGGNTEYEAILVTVGWDTRKYTLVSVKTGRKRYQVPEDQITRWSERIPVKAVRTSLGRVARPRNWKTLDHFSGGARKTYIGEKWVFKKGHSSWGEERCQVEAARYAIQSGRMTKEEVTERFGAGITREAEDYAEVPVAECYLLEDGTLMMERVLPIRSLQAGSGAPSMTAKERDAKGYGYGGRAIPRWADHIDSQQIGINRHGDLVAYDL